MKLFSCLLLVSVCAVVLMPTEAGWGSRVWKGVTRVASRVGRAVRKTFCQIGYGLVCPAAVGAVSGGTLAAVGKATCAVKKSDCKKRTLGTEEEELRSAGMMKVKFDPDFNDYDHDRDGYVDFVEFVETIAYVIPIDVAELADPFYDADINGDGVLSEEEFDVAPWDFDTTDDEDE